MDRPALSLLASRGFILTWRSAMPNTWSRSMVMSLGVMALMGLSACGGTERLEDASPLLEVGEEGQQEAALIPPCFGYSQCSPWSEWYATRGWCSGSSWCPVCVQVLDDPYCQSLPQPVSPSDWCCVATGNGYVQVTTYERYRECSNGWGDTCVETEEQSQLGACGC
ncbi:hypothetical protein [Myxococcus sp. RHSTA-1-4]|uniref:hypothetical protein n=1 Tax=Myxococcus sp. RHSTA-1-4 TaxID=2874601 RepID=UPI001CC17483|nr:hypothetical protein [Myxococcus sp. RHSTA-1-4]MBZ4420497.1 hypothetical protein [Myxococcus sp. RHSTA-1-4]